MRIADLRGVNDRGMLWRRDAPACTASARAGCRDVRRNPSAAGSSRARGGEDGPGGFRAWSAQIRVEAVDPRPGITPAASLGEPFARSRAGSVTEGSAPQGPAPQGSAPIPTRLGED